MYKGIPFSPQVALADGIGAGDTTIPVTDISAFPDAPNLATIGTDEDGETILYTAKTTDSLSGCTRGVEGTAKAWPSGTTIARNFTNKDFDALQKNIQEAKKQADQGVGDAASAKSAAATARAPPTLRALLLRARRVRPTPRVLQQAMPRLLQITRRPQRTTPRVPLMTRRALLTSTLRISRIAWRDCGPGRCGGCVSQARQPDERRQARLDCESPCLHRRGRSRAG